MSEAATADHHDENSVSGLWETARWFMGWLTGVCGTSCALVRKPWLTRKERRDIAVWLRPVEALLRRLLVVEAARIAQTLPREKRTAGGTGKRPGRPPFCRVSFPDPENSAGWSVRFSMSGPLARAPASPAGRLCPRVRSLETGAHVLAPAALKSAAAEYRLQNLADSEPSLPRPERPRRAGNPWPLARRIEAAARVLANPGRYARRLARRMRKDAARLIHACRPPPPPEPGRWPRYGDGPVREASEHALQALAAIDTG